MQKRAPQPCKKKRRKRAKNLTPVEKKNIIGAYANGVPPRVISQVIGRSASQISRFYSTHLLYRGLPTKHVVKKSAFEKCVMIEMKRLANKAIKAEQPLSSRKIQEELLKHFKKPEGEPQVRIPSHETIRKTLHDAEIMKTVLQSVKPYLNDVNKKKDWNLQNLGSLMAYSSTGTSSGPMRFWSDLTLLTTNNGSWCHRKLFQRIILEVAAFTVVETASCSGGASPKTPPAVSSLYLAKSRPKITL